MEGTSQIPGTNDSTLRQLKPPHPSHVEGPVSPRRLNLATYPNPHPSGADFLHLPLLGPGTPPRSASPLKSLLDAFLVSWSFT